MGRLDGKVAVVTGGASGIGRGCATRFAEEGARVVVADLQEDRGKEVADELGGLFVAVDTSSEDDCDALATTVSNEMGGIDVLVAAAGISHASYVSGSEPREAQGLRETTFVLNKPLENWRRVIDVNLTGVMLTNRSVAKAMIETGRGGAIVNIASGAAKLAIPGAADYCVSKAGVWMLTKCLALELAPHRIRVNAVGPGFIETPMTASMRTNQSMVDSVVARTPARRMGRPDDIANACLYLVSDEASFVTGEILYPDGGLDAASR